MMHKSLITSKKTTRNSHFKGMGIIEHINMDARKKYPH